MFQKFLAVLMVATMSSVAFAGAKVVEKDEHKADTENKGAEKRASDVNEAGKKVNKAAIDKGQDIVNPNARRSGVRNLLESSSVVKRNTSISADDLSASISAVSKKGSSYEKLDQAGKMQFAQTASFVGKLKARGMKYAAALAIATTLTSVATSAHADVQLTSHALIERADLDLNKTVEAIKANAEIDLLNGKAAAENCLAMSKPAVENLESAVIEAAQVKEHGADAMFDAVVKSLDENVKSRTHEENTDAVCLLGNNPTASMVAKGVEGHCDILKGQKLNLAQRCAKR